MASLPSKEQSTDVIRQRTDEARRQAATDQDKHERRARTDEHLFVGKMKSFDGLNHLAYIVRRLAVCRVVIRFLPLLKRSRHQKDNDNNHQ